MVWTNAWTTWLTTCSEEWQTSFDDILDYCPLFTINVPYPLVNRAFSPSYFWIIQTILLLIFIVLLKQIIVGELNEQSILY